MVKCSECGSEKKNNEQTKQLACVSIPAGGNIGSACSIVVASLLACFVNKALLQFSSKKKFLKSRICYTLRTLPKNSHLIQVTLV